MTPDITDNQVNRGVDYTETDGNTKEQCRWNRGYDKSNSPIDNQRSQEDSPDSLGKNEGLFSFKAKLIWRNIIFIGVIHLVALYCYATFDYLRDLRTLAWMYVYYITSGVGVTAGAHRYWTHKSYKATRPFQVILALAFSASAQNRIFDWVRDHRVHHKFTDTDADPHNSNRGFFFSHVGWLMMRKHPKVIEKGRQIDMSDICNDPVVIFADKYFPILKLVFGFVLPTMLPVYLWNETWSRAIVSQCIMRYVFVLNTTWSVNSVAHIWGSHPYDKSMKPCDNIFVSYLAGGEGWHNYHHVFPWDHKTSEFGGGMQNITTSLLYFFAKFGMVYDFKEPSPQLIRMVAERRGDGTWKNWQEASHDSAEYGSKKLIITEEPQIQ